MNLQGDALGLQRAALEPASRVEPALEACWRELLADPASAGEIAAVLGVPVDALATLDGPPLRVESPRSNAGPAEIGLMVVVWIASEVVLGVVKDMAKDELKRRLQTLWEEHLAPAVDRRMKRRGATGTPDWPELGVDEAPQTATTRPGP